MGWHFMIGAAIKKDVWLLLRDRGALISLFLLPIIFIVAFGSMFSFGDDKGKPREVPVWHAPGDSRGEAIRKVLEGSDGARQQHRREADAVRAAAFAIAGIALFRFER